jgi:SAM-dependent methyltransferase
MFLDRLFGGDKRRARARWERGLASEVSFWDEWIAGRGGLWSEGFKKLLRPGRELEEQFRRLIPAGEGEEVRLLDVGAGPLTALAVQWPGRRVVTTAVDPLADDYNRLLDQHGIVPVVRTRRGEAEHLSELFAADSFDLVYAANCLDHSYDPLRAIREMITVVKPGRFVMLEHAENEAVANSYEGLHQWNFLVESGQFLVWRPGDRKDVQKELGPQAEVTSTAHPLDSGRRWLSILLKKASR